MQDDSSFFIRLYIDEDVHESIAATLRRYGYDAVNTREVQRRGLTDEEQLAYAISENRTLFSFNATDYIALHLEYLTKNRAHAGIITAKQLPIGETVRRLLQLFDHTTADEMRNQLRWLSS